jgi:nucleoside-diphosphate-sugar epimerase
MSLTLITGAPGWVGTRLVQLLLEGKQEPFTEAKAEDQRRIRCLVMPDLDPSALGKSEQLEIIRGNLCNLEEVQSFCKEAQGATLFHCAGLIHPKIFVRNLFDVNVQGTKNLLQAAEDNRIRRVIVVSSNSPIGVNPRRDHLFDEGSPYNPYMSYGRSKMLMEKVVHEYQSRGRLETVILRPTWFYGPCQPERQTTFFRMIKNGKSPIVGDGENLRSMVYIDNLCQALYLSEQNSKANGQTYWVADKRPYSMNEIIDTVERLMEQEFGLKVKHKRLKLPYLASEVAQLCDGMLQMVGLYQQKIHVLSEMNKTIACSVEKAQRELGYMPKIELEEGMRRSLAWCIEKGIAL